MLEQAEQEGDMYADFWAGAVHYTDLPPPSEARAIKKQWVDWGKKTRPIVGLAELPPEQLKAVIETSLYRTPTMRAWMSASDAVDLCARDSVTVDRYTVRCGRPEHPVLGHLMRPESG